MNSSVVGYEKTTKHTPIGVVVVKSAGDAVFVFVVVVSVVFVFVVVRSGDDDDGGGGVSRLVWGRGRI